MSHVKGTLAFKVFKREMRAFFRVRSLWIVFLAQPLLLAGFWMLMVYRMLSLFKMQPDLASLMISRHLSTMLISYSSLAVVHLVHKNVAQEKTAGLIDTLLTTPLTIGELVWGKALHMGVLGYCMGLAMAIFNIAFMSAVLGDWSAVSSVGRYYWAFAFVVAPFTVIVCLATVTTAVLLSSDGRSVLVAFTMGVFVLLSVSAGYRNQWMEHLVMILIGLLGIVGAVVCRILSRRLTRERILSA